MCKYRANYLTRRMGDRATNEESSGTRKTLKWSKALEQREQAARQRGPGGGAMAVKDLKRNQICGGQ